MCYLKRVQIYDFGFDVCKYMILALIFAIYDKGKYMFVNNIFGFDVKNIYVCNICIKYRYKEIQVCNIWKKIKKKQSISPRLFPITVVIGRVPNIIYYS